MTKNSPFDRILAQQSLVSVLSLNLTLGAWPNHYISLIQLCLQNIETTLHFFSSSPNELNLAYYITKVRCINKEQPEFQSKEGNIESES